jgi:hypothetical protein
MPPPLSSCQRYDPCRGVIWVLRDEHLGPQHPVEGFFAHVEDNLGDIILVGICLLKLNSILLFCKKLLCTRYDRSSGSLAVLSSPSLMRSVE